MQPQQKLRLSSSQIRKLRSWIQTIWMKSRRSPTEEQESSRRLGADPRHGGRFIRDVEMSSDGLFIGFNILIPFHSLYDLNKIRMCRLPVVRE